MTKVIAVASGKGGVGKTTTAVNLGAALASFNRSAIIVDGNLRTPNVGIHLGAPVVKHSIHDALSMKKSIRDCVYTHPSGARIVPASISLNNAKRPNYGNLGGAIRELKGASEIVILDSAAGLGDDMFSAVSLADEAIIVTTPDLPSVTDSLKSIQMIEEKGTTVIGVVVNKVRNDKLEISLADIEALLEKPVIASIPEDKNMREALKNSHPIVYSNPDSPSSAAYKELAALLIGQKYEVLPKKGFIAGIFKNG